MRTHSAIVATFVAAAGATLSQDFLDHAVERAEQANGNVIKVHWLAKDKAADVFLTHPDIDRVRAQFIAHIDIHPVDVIVQAAATRHKKLLVADMESTMIEQEMLDVLADHLGFGAQMKAMTASSMGGKVDFKKSLQDRVKLLEGVSIEKLAEVAGLITYMPGSEALLAVMKKNGATCWLVTGGFEYFAKPVAKHLDFDEWHMNRLVIENGKLTGELFEPIIDRVGKKMALEQACIQHSLSMNEALAIGDGANDIDMLKACNAAGGLGVAYYAKQAVKDEVPHQINNGDLSVLLYAQGYPVLTP